MLLRFAKRGTNEYTGLKQLPAVDIGELLAEARSVLTQRQALEGCKDVTSITHTLNDGGDRDDHLACVVELGQMISIGFDTYGDCGTAEGYGRPVAIELYDGELRVLVWSDVNYEDPTHIISLAGAKEASRREC